MKHMMLSTVRFTVSRCLESVVLIIMRWCSWWVFIGREGRVGVGQPQRRRRAPRGAQDRGVRRGALDRQGVFTEASCTPDASVLASCADSCLYGCLWLGGWWGSIRAYNPKDYAYLQVSQEVRDLFLYIQVRG